MDNILKLIFGCLGLVALIVMIVPNSDPLASNNAENQGAPPISSAPPPGEAAPPPPYAEPAQSQNSEGEFVVDDYDIASFGQPMVDPTPPGQRSLISQQQQQAQQQQNGQGNIAQPQMNGTESAGIAGPPPPPQVAGN